jgi:hypothetical protein
MINKALVLNDVSFDASQRLRVGTLNTLFDGKTLNADDATLYNTVGTGTGTWASNTYQMSVTSGQYLIRQGMVFANYGSGKSQMIELTFENFQVQANVSKRVGYFSSSVTAPYNTVYDGICLENDGTTIRIRTYNNGVSTNNIPITSWDGYNQLSSYNWSNFTIILFDFLWLGGSAIRMFVVQNGTFVLAHTIKWAGTTTGTIILSPNQPVRYEIISSTGSGSFTPICAQISTEGSYSQAQGKIYSTTTSTTGVTLAAIGTNYFMLGVRKNLTYRNASVQVIGLSTFISSAGDQCYWTLEYNPTLTGGVTNTATTEVTIATNATLGTPATASGGIVLASGFSLTNILLSTSVFESSLSTYLKNTIADATNTTPLLAVCMRPITTNITAFATLNYKVF